MPLSKAKMRERKRQARVKPNSIPDVKPNKAGGEKGSHILVSSPYLASDLSEQNPTVGGESNETLEEKTAFGVQIPSQPKIRRGGGMADTQDLKSSGEIREGSTPSLGTQPTPIEREPNQQLLKALSAIENLKLGKVVQSETLLPVYNPLIHKPGDIVRIPLDKGYAVVTVPEADGGDPQQYGHGRLIVDKPNLSHKFKRFGKDEQIHKKVKK